jgi:CheY-like chemotaxis protein
MPVISGYEAIEIIRTQPPFNTDRIISTTPVILMSAFIARRDEIGTTAERGFDDMITKPVCFTKLRKMIVFWSQRRVAQRFGELQHGAGYIVPLPPTATWGPFPLRSFRGPRSLL